MSEKIKQCMYRPELGCLGDDVYGQPSDIVSLVRCDIHSVSVTVTHNNREYTIDRDGQIVYKPRLLAILNLYMYCTCS